MDGPGNARLAPHCRLRARQTEVPAFAGMTPWMGMSARSEPTPLFTPIPQPRYGLSPPPATPLSSPSCTGCSVLPITPARAEHR